MDGDTSSIIVIVPCYNEAERIPGVLADIECALPGARIVVINDASSDSSSRVVREAGATVLTHGCNLGYGAALETGYLYAMGTDCDYVLQMDGDGQHLASELQAVLRPLQEDTADLVIGSRYGADDSTEASSPLRRLAHRIFSGIIRLFTGLRISDPTSGFQGLNRNTLRLFASGTFPCDYPDSDVLLMAHLSGLRVAEVPVRMKQRSGGASMHDGLKPLYYGIKMLLSVFIVVLNIGVWKRWKKDHNVSQDPTRSE